MSGGHFNYEQFRIKNVAEELFDDFLDQDSVEYEQNEEVREAMKACYIHMMYAYVMLHRIDWLVSGDDGEDNFPQRLREDMQELQANMREKGLLS